MEQAASLDYVIGAEWFTLVDNSIMDSSFRAIGTVATEAFGNMLAFSDIIVAEEEFMKEDTPRLYVDSLGVWRENQPNTRSGIEWEEIFSIYGGKLDEVTHTSILITLEFVYGHFIELSDNWSGFDAVVQAIQERLPGIAPDWLAPVKRLNRTDAPLELWRKPDD